MNCTQANLELHTYLDDELALERVLALESHIESCEPCRQRHAQHAAARQLVRRHATCHAAPRAIVNQVKELAEQQRLSSRRRLRIPGVSKWWQGLGAAFAALLVASWVVATQFQTAALDDRLPDAVVGSHVRSLLSGSSVDFESSEFQTVRSWLTRKLGFTVIAGNPDMYDYRLVGARMDYVHGRAVAALVYRQSNHVVTVFAWPMTGEQPPFSTFSRRGYNLVNWTRNGLFFCAVADLDQEELELFSQALKNLPG